MTFPFLRTNCKKYVLTSSQSNGKPNPPFISHLLNASCQKNWQKNDKSRANREISLQNESENAEISKARMKIEARDEIPE